MPRFNKATIVLGIPQFLFSRQRDDTLQKGSEVNIIVDGRTIVFIITNIVPNSFRADMEDFYGRAKNRS